MLHLTHLRLNNLRHLSVAYLVTYLIQTLAASVKRCFSATALSYCAFTPFKAASRSASSFSALAKSSMAIFKRPSCFARLACERKKGLVLLKTHICLQISSRNGLVRNYENAPETKGYHHEHVFEIMLRKQTTKK